MCLMTLGFVIKDFIFYPYGLRTFKLIRTPNLVVHAFPCVFKYQVAQESSFFEKGPKSIP